MPAAYKSYTLDGSWTDWSLSHTLSVGLNRWVIGICEVYDPAASKKSSMNFGGQDMGVERVAGHSGDNWGWVQMFAFEVPDGWNGAKTMTATGGEQYGAMACVEISSCGGVKQVGSNNGKIVTLSNVLPTSVCVDAHQRAYSYTGECRNHEIYRDGISAGDSTHASGSGWETGTGTIEMEWDISYVITHIAMEMIEGDAGGPTAIAMFFRQYQDFMDRLRQGLIPQNQLEKEYGLVMSKMGSAHVFN